MHHHSLFKWLLDKAIEVKGESKHSKYFIIFPGLTIRYSDHISKSDGELVVIHTESNEYIIYIKEFGIPKIFTKVADVKRFIDDFIFIYKCNHHISQINDIKENIYLKVEPKEEKVSLVSTQAKSILSIINSNYNHKHWGVLEKTVASINKELRESVLIYYFSHPDKQIPILEFIKSISSYDKVRKKEAWNKYINKK